MTALFGPFALDAETRRLRRGTAIVHLTPNAFDLLHLLVTEAPRVMTKRELHERLRLAAARLDWNSGVHVVGTRTVLEPFLTEVRRLQREAERR